MRLSASSVILFLVGCLSLFVLARYLISEHALVSFDEYMASTTPPAGASSDGDSDDDAIATPQPFAGVPAALLVQASTTIQTPGGALHLDIATTTQEQEQGLSGRSGLARGAGMLFVFPEAGIFPFWMKDMRFPIDIVWVDDSMTVIGTDAAVPPASYPATFSPSAPVRYVIELRSGAAKASGLVQGSHLVF